jgi:hypothetical protein
MSGAKRRVVPSACVERLRPEKLLLDATEAVLGDAQQRDCAIGNVCCARAA